MCPAQVANGYVILIMKNLSLGGVEKVVGYYNERGQAIV